MSSHRRLVIRRTAIVVLIFGTFVAAFVLVLAQSDKDDPLRRPGETCIYLTSGRQLCGERAEEFCRRPDVVGADQRDPAARTCARIRRDGARS